MTYCCRFLLLVKRFCVKTDTVISYEWCSWRIAEFRFWVIEFLIITRNLREAKHYFGFRYIVGMPNASLSRIPSVHWRKCSTYGLHT